MSRIGKNAIAIPDKTEVKIGDGVIAVKGPKGELRRRLSGEVTVTVNGSEVQVMPVRNTGLSQALWGTYASHIRNMVAGVNEPFTKRLIVEGIGYKANVSGKKIVLDLGFSHDIDMEIPEGLEVTADKGVITISGPDKEQVGQFAANIRALKKPEPYKGKGIRYDDETVRRKEGKKGAA
jgi:large subunit ribosomal protein L6